MKKLRLIICMTIMLLLTSATAARSNAESLFGLDDCGEILGVYPYADDSFLILSSNNYEYITTQINSDGTIAETMTGVSVSDALFSYHDGRFFFSSIAQSGGVDRITPVVTTQSFNCKTGSLTTKMITDSVPDNIRDIVCGDDRVYLLTPTSLMIYSQDMQLIDTIRLPLVSRSLTISESGDKVFCAAVGGTIVYDNGTITTLPYSCDKVYSFGEYISLNDPNDDICVICGSDGDILYSGFNRTNGCAFADNILVGRKGSGLTAKIEDDEIPLGFASANSFICSVNDTIGCFTQNGSSADIQIFSVTEIQQRITDINTVSDSSENSVKPAEMQPDENTLTDKFTFDDSSMTVFGIEPGTTAAKFRSYPGCADAEFFAESGNSYTTGQLATAMKVKLNGKGSYTIVITGDIVGHGKPGISDLKQLEEYLAHQSSLEGAHLLAADMNSDNTVDIKDAALLYAAVR